jgi:CelD/BcsL family acetyltransferase involved in cellulose biosynthesis
MNGAAQLARFGPPARGVADIDDLRRRGWDDLLLSAAFTDPCRRAGWLTAENGTDADVLVVAVDQDDTLDAAMILRRERRFGVRFATDLGADRTWFDLTPPASSPDQRRSLMRSLRELPVDLVVLNAIDDGSDYARAVDETFPEALQEPVSPTYRVDLSAPGSRLSKRRAEVRRNARRASEAGCHLQIATRRRWTEVRANLDEVLAFHARHFRGPGPDNLSGTVETRRRYRNCLEDAGASGGVRLTTVCVEDRLLAFDISLVAARTAVGFAMGFDAGESRARGLGWAALLATLDAVAAEGVTTFDLGTGASDSYKRLVGSPVDRHRAFIPLTRVGRLAVAAHRRRAGRR